MPVICSFCFRKFVAFWDGLVSARRWLNFVSVSAISSVQEQWRPTSAVVVRQFRFPYHAAVFVVWSSNGSTGLLEGLELISASSFPLTDEHITVSLVNSVSTKGSNATSFSSLR